MAVWYQGILGVGQRCFKNGFSIYLSKKKRMDFFGLGPLCNWVTGGLLKSLPGSNAVGKLECLLISYVTLFFLPGIYSIFLFLANMISVPNLAIFYALFMVCENPFCTFKVGFFKSSEH